MPLIYALVGRGKTVLAEYTCAQGNFPTVTRILLAKIPPQDTRMSYVYDNHTFHYIIDNGITFLCLSDGDMKRRLIFEFLEEIKSRWRSQFSDSEQTAIAFGMNLSFSPVLKSQLVSHQDIVILFHSLSSSGSLQPQPSRGQHLESAGTNRECEGGYGR
jgi:hypothetical protein